MLRIYKRLLYKFICPEDLKTHKKIALLEIPESNFLITNHNLQMLNFIYALVIPVLILGLLYLFIIENNGLPDWMERVSRNSGSVWT